MIYDYIVIGGGLGGLSAANFLAKEGKKVLLLEKHDKPGGCLTSFKRDAYLFDTGHEGLAELAPGEIIHKFLEYWGTSLKVRPRTENLLIKIAEEEYSLSVDNFRDDLFRYFSKDEGDIDRFLSLNRKIMSEMLSGDAPESPEDMSLFEKIMFGISSGIKKPAFMKYGLKNSEVVLEKIFRNQKLKMIAFSRLPMSAVYMASAYRWETVLNKSIYYPSGGMQALPDTVMNVFVNNGGEVRLKSEVDNILIEDNSVYGVRLKNGEEIRSGRVISNVSVPYTLSRLIPEESRNRKYLKTILKKRTFPSAYMLFYGMKKAFPLQDMPAVSLFPDSNYRLRESDYRAENSPIMLIPGDTQSPDPTLVAVAPVSYDHIPEGDPCKILDRRICSALGVEFSGAVNLRLTGTPGTLERYTHSHRGSYMGWNIDSKSYGKFLSSTSPHRNLYFSGQYVFPGFGAAGVMASGYYLVKRLLANENIDIEKKFKEYFY